MAYIYTIYTPNGTVVVPAHNHNQDQLHKLALTDVNYNVVGEFQVWHGYTRELLVQPSPEAAPSPHAPVEHSPPPVPGDYPLWPIVFPELPADDEFPF